MKCKECEEKLVCYVEGLLIEQERFAVEEHVDTCRQCGFEADATVKLYDMLSLRGAEICGDGLLEEKVLEEIYMGESQRADSSYVAGVALSIRHLRKNLVRYIAAASIVFAVILGIHLLGNSAAEANIAWARVAENILNAEAATFDVIPGGGPVIKNIVGNQYRKKILGDGQEVITDYSTGHVLLLNNVTKKAYFIESGNVTNYSNNYFQYLKDNVEILKQSANTKVAPLGTRTIDDRLAKGLHVYNDSVDLKIWTDVEDGLPALVTYDKILGQSTLEMRNFKFDVPAEELAFNMEVPAEYTLEVLAIDLLSPTEEDFIEALDMWANVYLDGQFPERLDGGLLIEQAEMINKKNEELWETEKEKLEATSKIVKGLLFVQKLPADSDWQYTGKGVTTDDAMSIIFRYKPQGSETYRVIYGDLFVEDIDLNN